MDASSVEKFNLGIVHPITRFSSKPSQTLLLKSKKGSPKSRSKLKY